MIFLFEMRLLVASAREETRWTTDMLFAANHFREVTELYSFELTHTAHTKIAPASMAHTKYRLVSSTPKPAIFDLKK